MKVATIVLGLIVGVASATNAHAGVPATAVEPAGDSTSVQAVRAVITRCLPGINQAGDVVTTGLDRLPEDHEQAVLGDRDGRVYIEGESFLMIDFDDAPVCRVVALSVDPAVLADLVLQVFVAAEDTFRPAYLRIETDGSFVAVFQGTKTVEGIEIRITTTREKNGNVFASLNVAATAADANSARSSRAKSGPLSP
ncbi:MAG: hypothetical protein AAF409_22240 [Pseudomonadota bacterium]